MTAPAPALPRYARTPTEPHPDEEPRGAAAQRARAAARAAAARAAAARTAGARTAAARPAPGAGSPAPAAPTGAPPTGAAARGGGSRSGAAAPRAATARAAAAPRAAPPRAATARAATARAAAAAAGRAPSAAAAAVDAYAAPRGYRRPAREIDHPEVVPSLREAVLPARAPRPRARPRALSLGVRPRWPFFVLVLVLLVSGLIGLLVLNTALAQGAFRLHDLQNRSSQLDDAQQELSRKVDELSDPAALARRAAALGMAPADPPTFLRPGAPLPKTARYVRGPDGERLVVVPGGVAHRAGGGR